jgi:hypothetical protein
MHVASRAWHERNARPAPPRTPAPRPPWWRSGPSGRCNFVYHTDETWRPGAGPRARTWRRPRPVSPKVARPHLTECKALTPSPAPSAPLLRRQPAPRGSGARTVLYFGYCIELQNCLRRSEEAKLPRKPLRNCLKSPGIGAEPVSYQAQKTARQGSISAFRATEDPPSRLLQLLFRQFQKGNSRNCVSNMLHKCLLEARI